MRSEWWSEGNSSMISRARVRAHAEGVRPIGGRLRVSVPPSKLQGARRPSVTQRSPWIRFAPLAARVVAESLQNASVSPAESVRACPRFDTKRPLCRAARQRKSNNLSAMYIFKCPLDPLKNLSALWLKEPRRLRVLEHSAGPSHRLTGCLSPV
jgi:hypothetical protein